MGLLVFFRAFFSRPISKRFLAISFGYAAAIFLIFVFFGKTNESINFIFLLTLLPVVIVMFYSLGLTCREVLRRNPDAITLLVGVLAGVFCGTYDVVYKVKGIMPEVWIQGYGIFILELAMFASLSIRSIKANRKLARYAEDIREKSAKLDEFVAHVERTSESISRFSTEIDAGVNAVTEVANHLSHNAEKIKDTSESQAKALSSTGSALGGILKSQETVNTGIHIQTNTVSQAARAMDKVFQQINAINENARSTSEFTKRLEELSDAGQASLRALSEAVEKIRRAEEEILPIVDAVDDFAEQTNLLAMNAAIEASHAGSAGRGFAVIATEIKKLAQASQQRSSQIRDAIKGIAERISEGVGQNAYASKSLEDIKSGTMTATKRIETLYGSISELQNASEQTAEAMRELERASLSIKDESAAQTNGSQSIRENMSALENGTFIMEKMIENINKGSGELHAAMERLHAVSKEGGDLIADLGRLVAGRKA
jgi:methyl-accepting chemotaxis protein